jgi:hypothetical protein
MWGVKHRPQGANKANSDSRTGGRGGPCEHAQTGLGGSVWRMRPIVRERQGYTERVPHLVGEVLQDSPKPPKERV